MSKQVLINELDMLRMKWGLWKGLFMSKHGTDLLNRASGVAGACILDSLRRDVALGLARVLDPAQQLGNENIALESVIQAKLPSDLKAFQTKVRQIRNKYLAHNDLKTVQDSKRISYGFTDIEVDNAFTQIMALLENPPTIPDGWIREGEEAAEKLLQKLDCSCRQ